MTNRQTDKHLANKQSYVPSYLASNPLLNDTSSSITTMSILQINLNHAIAAQALLERYIVNNKVCIALISEPYNSNKCGWFGDTYNKAAIIVNNPRIYYPNLIDKGDNYIAVEVHSIIFISIYCPPNENRNKYEKRLHLITTIITKYNHLMLIIGGDFNAHSKYWGSTKNSVRGKILYNWVKSNRLYIQNVGNNPTCIRPQGSSIVDITFANSKASANITGWRVINEESLSDHLYIEFFLHPLTYNKPIIKSYPRWNVKSFNEERAEAATLAYAWGNSLTSSNPFQSKIDLINKYLTGIANISMTRCQRTSRLPPQSWWSNEIKTLRNSCQQYRRKWQKLKKKLSKNNTTIVNVKKAETLYRNIKKRLKNAIYQAKNKQWRQEIVKLDDDPWGRPYRWATKKSEQQQSVPLTESMDPTHLRSTLDHLFPSLPPCKKKIGEFIWKENLAVTPQEVSIAVKKMLAKNSAPGISGVPAIV
ncbi:uncharacterized protein LOC108630445, partial [Ceratina calcarata]|uniref:Uncharacterized protein LOC108630445 n=1 Tax=Ceratina calcarata TaxID=156304 RepID=A0AAJ7NCZ2_9HYME